MSLKLVNQDHRRSLYEFGEGKWKCAKYIEVKDDCEIGGHYHLKKDECFLLLEGEMKVKVGQGVELKVFTVHAPAVVEVPKGMYHSFTVKRGSKIVGLMSEKYNKQDDHM